MPNNKPPNPHTQTEEWIEWKRRKIGGHAAVTLSGASYSSTGEKHYQTPAELYDRIVHGIVDRKTEDEEDFLAWRLSLEPNIAARYVAKTGRKLQKCGALVHPDNPNIIAAPDRRILKDPRGPGQLEIKSRDPMVWQAIKLNGAPGADWVQTQHYLMVEGRSKFSGICEANCSSGKLIHFDVDADFDFQRVLFQRITEFLEDCAAGKRPADAPAEPVRLPKVGGELVTVEQMQSGLVGEFKDLVASVVESRSLLARAKDFHDDVKKTAQDWMLRNQIDVVEGFGQRIYYKEQAGKKSFDRKALQRDHPDIDLSRYETRGNPFRSFRVYERPVAIPERNGED